MLCIDQRKGHRLSTQHPYSVAMNQYFLKEPLWLSDPFKNRTDIDSEYYFWFKNMLSCEQASFSNSFSIIEIAISIEIAR